MLTPLAESDTAALHALWTAPAVRRYLWDDAAVPYERTAEVVAESCRLFAAGKFGLWGARRPAAPDLVGFGGFWAFREPGSFELLYGVGVREWGRGLATEIAGALVSYAFDALRWPAINASTDAPNRASARVLDKLGFRLQRRAVVGGLDTSFFRLERCRRAAPRDPAGR